MYKNEHLIMLYLLCFLSLFQIFPNSSVPLAQRCSKDFKDCLKPFMFHMSNQEIHVAKLNQERAHGVRVPELCRHILPLMLVRLCSNM